MSLLHIYENLVFINMVCLGSSPIMEIYDPNFRFKPDTLTITLDTEDLKRLAKAINTETRRKILQVLTHGLMDISKLTKELNQSEANISAQIKILQDTGIISCQFIPGDHGTRKVCRLNYSTFVIEFY